MAAECAEDLADDGVVYAEIRFAPELHIESGARASTRSSRRCSPASSAAPRGRELTVRVLCSAMRQQASSLEIAELALRHRDAGRLRLRHRRPRGRLPARAPPGRLLARDARGLPHHDPRRRGVRPALDRRGPARLRRRAAGPRGAHHRRHRRSTARASHALGRLAAFVRDRRVPLELCPSSNVHVGAAPSIADHPVGLLAGCASA